MCGIAGIIDTKKGEIDRGLLSKMCNAARHRGPDDEGYSLYEEKCGVISLFGGDETSRELMLPHMDEANSSYSAGFGFRRLSIVDLTVSGHQPMVSADRRYMMVFNGEIYNYLEIRGELELDGIRFISDSDSEVVLKAYQKWGRDCVTRFNGMWAICIFDAKDKSLFCSRDRLGVKPFYYHYKNGRFVFASEIKQLLLDEHCERTLDVEAANNFLVHATKDYSGRTLFKEISQLEPGKNLILSDGEICLERYWDFTVNDSYEFDGDRIESEKKFLDLFTSSVKLRLKADVPVGIALSGGLDSSSTAVVANQISESPLMTFNVAFDEDRYDERHYASLVTSRISCIKHEIKPSIATLSGELDDFIFHMEEPTRSLSTYSQWCLMRCVRESDVTVLLEGQGADELLGGYEWYFDSFFHDRLKSGSFSNFLFEIYSYRKNYRCSWLVILKTVLRSSGLLRKLQSLKGTNSQGIFNPEMLMTLKTVGPEGEALFAAQLDFGLRAQLRELLNYGDKSSMRFSVENRVPFLDFRLVDFATRLPLSSKINRGETKHILRQSLNGLLPEGIRKRYGKLGFATPQEMWQRDQLKDEIRITVVNSNLFDMKIFNGEKARDYFDEYFHGAHNDYHFVWRCFNFVKWMNLYKVIIPADFLYGDLRPGGCVQE